ncbi:MAG: triosephosphate isomerase [Pseudohongiellaceae bacterium]|jgi:triosephosphate isomerase
MLQRVRQKIVAGNWKMNGNVAFTRDYFEAFKVSLKSISFPENMKVLIAPPSALLSVVAEQASGSVVELSAQNVSSYKEGAYTGETSARILADLKCLWCLVGHSERRALFAETDNLVVEKIKQLLANDVQPVLCVGEALDQRESGQAEMVVAEQVNAVFDVFSESELSRVIVAYEPVWAIGTGKTATPDQAQAMHRFIRKLVAAKAERLAERLVILYGGSVNAENAETLFAQEDIDGALVGGASLQVEAFSRICEQLATSD